MNQFYVQAGGQVNGELRVPGDKSISHRSIIFGALAKGTTRVSGFLEGADSLGTAAAFVAMGVQIKELGAGRLEINGVGLHGLKPPTGVIDLGNSGTSMRLLMGLMAAQSFPVTLSGDESLCSRPMRRVAEPLAQMGADIGLTEQGTAPVHIEPATPGLTGIDYQLPVPSAQIKSALLLAGLYAQGKTTIREPAITRDHTERMLQAFAVELERGGQGISLNSGQILKATDISVPADISSAAFFMVAAVISPDAQLLLRDVGINPSRDGVIRILKAMGADIQLQNQRLLGAEPVADILIRNSRLKGIEIPVEWVPLAIDEFPVLAIAAACAEGETIITGASELRVKESDRIKATADVLTTFGVQVETREDGMTIHGGQITGGEVDSLGDHRIAMAAAVAGLVAQQPITINNTANVSTSFPDFAKLAAGVGLRIEERP